MSHNMDTSTWGSKTDATTVAEYYKDQIIGKTVLITGVSSNSLAAEFLKTVAKHNPKLLILASRNLLNIQKVVDEIKETNSEVSVRPLVVDLGSQASVHNAAAEVQTYQETIDILINNACLNGIREYTTTQEGFETTFAISHIGHFLFTGLIANKLASDGRIVNIASMQHWMEDVSIDNPNFDNGKTYDKDRAYGRAKSANIHFTKALARRGFNAVAIHPGVAKTNIMREFSLQEANSLVEEFGLEWQTAQQATSTYVYASFAPELSEPEFNGSFLKDCHVDKPAPHADNTETSEKLWTASEKWVGFSWPDRA